MKTILTVFIILLVSIEFAHTQEPTQIIKGKVVNIKNQLPVTGARVLVRDLNLGAISSADGLFQFDKVPTGRYILQITALGYDIWTQAIVLTSGKQLYINVEMNESFYETEEVTVTGKSNNFSSINESAIISSIQFSVDDAQRFAGSRMDPARMAQNFAGVLGANDTRNDIIIRGGSPIELMWRLDGLDIPNPNHFATQGATGGPVGAINTVLLDNSDFLTGAFPSEYVDKMSGVFDLKTRQGNRDKYEYLGQFGFNGFELGAEGPLHTNSSFIANYRYSFLGLMQDLGIDFGFSGIPEYQDGTLKYDWQINKKNSISLTGLFGISDIHIKESETDDVFTGDFDIQNGTDFLATVINWKSIYSENMWSNLLLGFNYQNYRTTLDSVTTNNDNKVLALTKWYDDNSSEGFTNLKYNLNFSISKHHYLKIGTEARFRNYNFKAERYTSDYMIDKNGTAFQNLNFINWNWNVSSLLKANFGLSSQYLAINNETTIEPRAAFSWNFLPKHNINVGWGIHRQSLPLVLHFANEMNEDLNFMQAVHYVIGYNYQFSNKAIIKLESYYKDLSNIPVENDLSSTWSFQNSGTGFGSIEIEKAVSNGLGKTYGAELSFIRNFADGYYITANLSYVRQEFKAGDGKWRWGAFDNQIILNMLAGYELIISPTFTMEFSAKYTFAGGKPYTPIDIEQSIIEQSTEFDFSRAFGFRARDYNRLDFRIDFRQNFQGISLISYFSIENLLNTQNFQSYVYDLQNNVVKEVFQLGFFPVGGIRVEF